MTLVRRKGQISTNRPQYEGLKRLYDEQKSSTRQHYTTKRVKGSVQQDTPVFITRNE